MFNVRALHCILWIFLKYLQTSQDLSFSCSLRMEYQIIKKLLQILVLLSAIAMLTWQIWGTFVVFIEQQTTISISKETFATMVPPTLIFCPMANESAKINSIKESNYSDKEMVFKQYYWQGRQTSQCHQCHGTGCFFGLEVSKPCFFGLKVLKPCFFGLVVSKPWNLEVSN